MKLSKKLAMTLAVSSCCLNVATTLPVSAGNTSAAKSQMSHKELLKEGTAKLAVARELRKSKGMGSDELSQAHQMLMKAVDGATAANDDATLADAYLAIADYRFVAHSLSMEEVDKALKIRERLYGKNSPKTAEAMNKAALMACWHRQYAKATDLLKSSIEIMDANKGAGAQSLGETLEASAQQGLTSRTGDVAKVFRRALVSMRKYLAKDDMAIIDCLNALGMVTKDNFYGSPQKGDDTPDYTAEAAALLKSKKPNDPKLAFVMENQAKAQASQGKYKEAAATFKDVIAMREKNGTSPLELARNYEMMADWLRGAQQFPEGDQYIKKALAVYEKNPGESNLALINGMNHAIYFFEHGPKPEMAIPYYEKRIAMKDRFLGQPTNFAALCMKVKRYDRAVTLWKQILTWTEKDNGGNKPTKYDIAKVCLQLGIAQTELGQLSEAQVNLERAKDSFLNNNYGAIPWLEAYTAYLQKAGKQAEYATYKAKLDKLREQELRACAACGMG